MAKSDQPKTDQNPNGNGNTGDQPPAEGNQSENQGGQSNNQQGEKDKNDSTEKYVPINLYKFLQLKPQKSGITALLISNYKGEAKTAKQWEDALNSLLAKKTK